MEFRTWYVIRVYCGYVGTVKQSLLTPPLGLKSGIILHCRKVVRDLLGTSRISLEKVQNIYWFLWWRKDTFSFQPHNHLRWNCHWSIQCLSIPLFMQPFKLVLRDQNGILGLPLNCCLPRNKTGPCMPITISQPPWFINLHKKPQPHYIALISQLPDRSLSRLTSHRVNSDSGSRENNFCRIRISFDLGDRKLPLWGLERNSSTAACLSSSLHKQPRLSSLDDTQLRISIPGALEKARTWLERAMSFQVQTVQVYLICCNTRRTCFWRSELHMLYRNVA